MLAAMSILSNASAAAANAAPARDYYAARQIVFVALAGEPWGYMGSRAFLWELERGGATVQGLDLALVDQVCIQGPCCFCLMV